MGSLRSNRPVPHFGNSLSPWDPSGLPGFPEGLDAPPPVPRSLTQRIEGWDYLQGHALPWCRHLYYQGVSTVYRLPVFLIAFQPLLNRVEEFILAFPLILELFEAIHEENKGTVRAAS